MANRFDLTGRVALVTGASSGIGRHAAHVFAAAGAKVGLVARRKERLDALADEIAGAGGVAFAAQLDVSDPEAVDPALDAVEAALGPIDVLFNNAGMGIAKPAFEHSVADWRAVLDTDLSGAWYVANAVAKRMGARGETLPPGGGSIINTTSVGATRTLPGFPSYMAAKAGLAHLTRQMAMELAPYRVRVNAIAPGMFVTEATPVDPDSDRGRAMVARIPLGRPARHEEIDGALLLLASDAGSYMTGAELLVDGGVSL